MTKSKADQESSLIEHLLELRNRLIYCLICIGIIFLCIFPFANDIYSYIASPLIKVLPNNANMISIGIISPFLTPVKMSFMLSLYLSMPFLLYQIWAYIMPALYKNEIAIIAPLLISSIVLFYLGLLFCYFIVFPLALDFLINAGPQVSTTTPDISAYLSFVLKISFAFGLAFEVPIATVILILTNVCSVESLKKNRPYVFIGAFVLGMLLTPPDVISQVLIAIPMWLLFELGLFISTFLIVKKNKIKK